MSDDSDGRDGGEGGEGGESGSAEGFDADDLASEEPPGPSGADRDPDEVPAEVADAAAPIESDEHWERMLEDVAAAADEHRRAGYHEVVVLHPRASGTVIRGEPGIAVVVAREEFDHLDATVSTRAVERYEVLRGEVPGRVHVLVQLYTDDADAVVLLPAAVDRDALAALGDAVADSFYTHVTPPEDDATVSFTLDDPSLFLPDAGGVDDTGDADDTDDGGSGPTARGDPERNGHGG